jgi:hypothetical protein
VRARKVSPAFARLVIRVHRTLNGNAKPLGFCGAAAIDHELADVGVRPCHSIRTIHRILVRNKRLVRTRRDRSRKGPVLPGPMPKRLNDVPQLDFIVGQYLASRGPIVVCHRKDVATGRVAGTEESDRPVQRVVAFLQRDWHQHGIPRVLHMDNDMSLTGGRMPPRTIGPLGRFWLACRVVAVLTPARRPASTAAVERYNGLWQATGWQRDRVRTLRDLRERSHAFQQAYNRSRDRRLVRQDTQGLFQIRGRSLPTPLRWRHPLPRCGGQIWFIRKIADDGTIQILNETIRLSTRYAHAFVRVVVRTGTQTRSVYWRSSAKRRVQRLGHRTYPLREHARTPVLYPGARSLRTNSKGGAALARGQRSGICCHTAQTIHGYGISCQLTPMC